MTSVKDLERCARLYEKEIAALADQLAEKESTLRFEVDRLRVSVEAIVRYLAERDASFPEAYGGEKGRRPQPLGDIAKD
jgi:uncharacterized coiled-coil protein SlyX